ncbi:DUF456 domain-containing protein [Aeromicrobium sp.]|uniref:DUF456 domain-containing protein n=1 Tax=Aeromicrobium sp. TaxID=1871063 RepID=UPI0039E3DDB8
MTTVEIVASLAIAVGIIGIVLPFLPGALLIAAALVGWAVDDGTTQAWLWAGGALLVLAVGQIVKYVVPGRRLKASGVPNSSVLIGGLLAIAGFFVIPVVGLFLGFLAGVYLAEYQRVGQAEAWPSTVAATKAVGLSILIELASGLVAAAVFAAALVLT